MTKRPLLWVLGAYLLGMYLAWYHISIFILTIVLLISYFLLYLIIYHIHQIPIMKCDYYMWTLPLLILLGFVIMGTHKKEPEIEQRFEYDLECELSGIISSIVQKKKGRVLYVKDCTIELSDKTTYYCEKVMIFCSDDQPYLIGNSIKVFGKLQKFSLATNPGQFNEWMYYKIRNIDYKMKVKTIEVTDTSYSSYHKYLYDIKIQLIQVYNSILPEREAGTIIAMLLGEKYLLDDELKLLYQENGITHILAISGLHISLIGVFLYKTLRKLKLGLLPSTILSICFIYSYGCLTNFSISTNRAVVMIIVMLLSGVFGKTYDMLSAIALSAFIILLNNPMQIFDIGFQLSFGAVLGIGGLLPCFTQLFPVENKVLNNIYVSLSAQSFTLPFVLWIYYRLPIYSIIINLLILPCMSILILSAFLAGVLGMIIHPLGVFFIGTANAILKFYEVLCNIGSQLPLHLIPVGKPEETRVITYFFLLILFVWSVRKFNNKRCLIIFILAYVVLLCPQSKGYFEITVLDVGQGDAIFMETVKGTTFLIDGGSTDISNIGKYRLIPFLLSKGISRIDYAIVTHTDLDHVNGLMEILIEDTIKIKHLILPDLEQKDKVFEELETQALQKGISVMYIAEGDYIQEGELYITCLHPRKIDQAMSKNANSTVLCIKFKEFDMLLTGDIEKDGELQLIELFQDKIKWQESSLIDYDILKVAHHGSKNSTPELLLHLIQPEISIISCSKNNRYGHPHKEVLDRLQDAGSLTKITYASGAITIKTDGYKIRVYDYVQ